MVTKQRILITILLSGKAITAAEVPNCEKILDGFASEIVASQAVIKTAGVATVAKNNAEATIRGTWERLHSPETMVACLDSEQRAAREATELDRRDKQIGASSVASGSTSAVPSGSLPRLIGLAYESGALARGVNGQSVTYRMNPAKLFTTLGGLYGEKEPTDIGFKALSRVNVALTVDGSRTATGESKASDLLARVQQVSEANGRIAIFNPRDLFSGSAARRLRDLRRSDAGKDALDKAAALLQAVLANHPDPAFIQNYNESLERLLKGEESKDQILDALISWLSQLKPVLRSRASVELRRYRAAMAVFETLARQEYKKIASAPTLHFEYAYIRSPLVTAFSKPDETGEGSSAASQQAPDLHSARLIFATKSFIGGELTATAATTFFSQDRPEMRGRFRDWQFGAKLDYPVKKLLNGKGTLSVNYLFLDLRQRPLGIDIRTFNDKKVNTAGKINLFQAKYSIALGDSGVSVPISFTISNRTELIDERNIRGNIGLTFDLDKLLAKK
jgi:hypothetical protein